MSVERVSIESERTVVLIAYVLHLVGAVAGVTSIIALILNYVRKGQYGAPLDSHHRWMIRSFWWAIVWIVLGCITMFVVIGWVILGITWVWYIYRHLRGLIALANGEAMPG